MKVFLKIIGWIILVVFILFIGVNIFLCTVGIPVKYKDMAVEMMGKKFNRQVEIKKVAFCLLKGIVIRDVTVMDKGKSLKNKDTNKDDVFIECKAFVFKYDLSEL